MWIRKEYQCVCNEAQCIPEYHYYNIIIFSYYYHYYNIIKLYHILKCHLISKHSLPYMTFDLPAHVIQLLLKQCKYFIELSSLRVKDGGREWCLGQNYKLRKCSPALLLDKGASGLCQYLPKVSLWVNRILNFIIHVLWEISHSEVGDGMLVVYLLYFRENILGA